MITQPVYEYRQAKYRKGAPTLLTDEELIGKHGFRSTFGYPPETYSWIRKYGTTKGMKNASVYCDTIFVDYDDEPAVANEAIARLVDMGAVFSVWDSGNRSVHLHIALEPIEGVWVAPAVKQWVRDTCRPSDLSYLHAAGMFRLPGTVHAKTGNAKVLTMSYAGTPVHIYYEREKTQTHEAPIAIPNTELLQRYQMNLITPVKPGARSQHISCILVGDAKRLGLSYEQALADIQAWNRRFAKPSHSPETVIRKVRYEYSQT